MIASLRCSQRLALAKADDDEKEELNLPDLVLRTEVSGMLQREGALRAARAPPLPHARAGRAAANAARERKKRVLVIWALRRHVSHDIRPPKHRDQETHSEAHTRC